MGEAIYWILDPIAQVPLDIKMRWKKYIYQVLPVQYKHMSEVDRYEIINVEHMFI